MRTQRSRVRAGNIAAIIAAAAVVAFAFLQYRWNQEASDTAALRLADSLQLSIINWHLDLFRNLSELALTMRVPAAGRVVDEDYQARLREWQSITRYPDMLSAAYAIRRSPAGSFEVTPLLGGRPAPAREGWPPAVARAVNYLDSPALLSEAAADPRPPQHGSFHDNVGSALRPWRFDPGSVALVGALGSPGEWLLLELNMHVLSDRILPELAQRYFQGTDGLDYDVAVVAGSNIRRVIYSSEPGFGAEPVNDADGRMDVFGRAAGGAGGKVDVFHRTLVEQRPAAAVGTTWFPVIGDAPPEEDWQLLVRHRRGGSLSAFVEQTRRRGLVVNVVSLSLLVVSLFMLVVATNRAQRFAQLQMDFVTTVSHELRTPLTIISSAAENIASGVVDTPTRVEEYGEVIGHEVTQLAALVERILRFAAIRDGRQAYSIEHLSAAEIVDGALAGTSRLIHAAQFTVERDVPPDLPLVSGDRMAVSQCLENLITNALKYGKKNRWIRVSAIADAASQAVRVSVSDQGLGIDPRELERIFEPFYRGREAKAAQIHGTGLGLALARQIAEDMGGTLTVESAPGQGSTFTIALPAVSAATPADIRT